MNKTTTDSTNNGIGFFGFLTLIFTTLKLTGFISWSWWWVLSPLWIPLAVGLVLVVVYFIVLCLQEVCAK